MEEQQAAPETQSLGTRIMNVFASPGEAFDGIATLESKTSLWLIPMLTSMAIAVLVSFVISSNATLKEQIVEMTSKQMQQRVEQGSVTQTQADRQREAMEGMGTLFAVFGSIGAIIAIAALFFLGSLVLWLIGKFALKATHGYTAYLATYGTASWITVLGSLVAILMMVGLNSMYATPSAALAVYADYDFLNTTHRLLSRIELFSIWQAVVVGIGLSKLTGKTSGVGIGIAVGLLAALDMLLVFVLGR